MLTVPVTASARFTQSLGAERDSKSTLMPSFVLATPLAPFAGLSETKARWRSFVRCIVRRLHRYRHLTCQRNFIMTTWPVVRHHVQDLPTHGESHFSTDCSAPKWVNDNALLFRIMPYCEPVCPAPPTTQICGYKHGTTAMSGAALFHASL